MDVDDEQQNPRPAPRLEVVYPESDEDFEDEEDDGHVSSTDLEGMTQGERRNYLAHRDKVRRKYEARKKQPPPKAETEWSRCVRNARMAQRLLKRDIDGAYRGVPRPPRYGAGEEAFMEWGYYANAHLEHLWRQREAVEAGRVRAPAPWDRRAIEPFRLPARPGQAPDGPHALAPAQPTTLPSLDVAMADSTDAASARISATEEQPLGRKNSSFKRTTQRETAPAADRQSRPGTSRTIASLAPTPPALPPYMVPATSSTTLQGT
ncbi:uncharacterized protein PHACADRAFT_202946 [Phanerochaete carnosa HHB-10118-sp]|uniref:Uncharacterized protein n=1 Tax=Phanerochaete carnosa (strain HHB-10118-sp) TaxID=650164 RepID=K5UFX1_PHACS|nr:uncharacterized protein PHACADRAFT_202946 [Phanerochaete carnosa HHB-10118-sp]EKM48336.1 hypothetical protein PHACADRAFT_202946 [Phanerochaete carnosa HHB-10118-sp]